MNTLNSDLCIPMTIHDRWSKVSILYQNVNISQNKSIFDNKLKRFRKLFLTIKQNQTNLSP